MRRSRHGSRRLPGGWAWAHAGVAGLASALILAAPSSAVADDSLGTAGGLTYVFDQSAATPPPTFAGADAVCPASQRLAGTSGSMAGSSTATYINSLYPIDGPDDGLRADDAADLDAYNAGAEAEAARIIVICTGREMKFRAASADLGAGVTRSVKAACPTKMHVAGGGALVTGPVDQGWIVGSYPYDGRDRGRSPDDGWRVRGYSNAIGSFVTAYAQCWSLKPRYRVTGPEDVPLTPGTTMSLPISCAPAENVVSPGLKISGDAAEARIQVLALTDDPGDTDNLSDDGVSLTPMATGDSPKTATGYAICKR